MIDDIFCKIVKGELKADKVYEDDEFIVIKDIHPQAPVHILLIPRRHVSSLNEASEADRGLLGDLLLAARRLAKEKGIETSGYRVVMNTMAGAGQSVFHVHLHLLGGRKFSWPPG